MAHMETTGLHQSASLLASDKNEKKYISKKHLFQYEDSILSFLLCEHKRESHSVFHNVWRERKKRKRGKMLAFVVYM